MKKLFFIAAFCMVQTGVYAGSTAVSKNSPAFTGWATGCTLQRGYADIADPSQGYPNIGVEADATGMADGMPLSLGDSGVAVLTFASPIYNGPGADFAVFENGFANPANPEEAFLELAFVEVSSDGVNFTRFSATSLSPANPQIPGAGEFMNARYINNLAGKYIFGYGTPFDLAELEGTPGLDINNITHVRIVDVIGATTGGHTQTDNDGNIINDPYPTPFPGGGFDLDAVGALYQHGKFPVGVNALQHAGVHIYPNPATDMLTIAVPDSYTAIFTDITGRLLRQYSLAAGNHQLSLSALPKGSYYLSLTDANGNKWAERITKL
jgi:hypothetical protein